MKAHLNDRHPRWQDNVVPKGRRSFEEAIAVSLEEEIALGVSQRSENEPTTRFANYDARRMHTPSMLAGPGDSPRRPRNYTRNPHSTPVDTFLLPCPPPGTSSPVYKSHEPLHPIDVFHSPNH